MFLVAFAKTSDQAPNQWIFGHILERNLSMHYISQLYKARFYRQISVVEQQRKWVRLARLLRDFREMAAGHWISDCMKCSFGPSKGGEVFYVTGFVASESAGRQCSNCCYTNLLWMGTYRFYLIVLWLPDTYTSWLHCTSKFYWWEWTHDMLNTPLSTLLDHQFEHILLYTLTFCLPSQAEVAGLISDECGGHNNPFVTCHQKATHIIACLVFLKRGLIFSCNQTGVKKWQCHRTLILGLHQQ